MDPELEAMQAVLAALTPLSAEERERVISWVARRFDVVAIPKKATEEASAAEEVDQASQSGAKKVEAQIFDTLGELFAAADPKTNGQKALVVGYWLQSHEGLNELDAQRINTELKHLGYGIANITTAMDEIKAGKPAMAIQLKKSGSTKQARKKYKITEAGLKAVEAALRGEEWR